MIKLYSRYRNSAGQRVRTTLNLKNIPYEYVAVEDMRSEAYRRINPQGLLPAMEIDGEIFGQSTALVEWLDETYPTPSIFPKDQKAKIAARSFSQFIACEIHPIHNHRVRDFLVDNEGWTEEKSMKWYEHWVMEGFATLESVLRRRRLATTYCFGETPSIADIYLVPVVGNARWFGFSLDRFPLIQEIDAACGRLDAFQKAMPKNQPDFPAGN